MDKEKHYHITYDYDYPETKVPPTQFSGGIELLRSQLPEAEILFKHFKLDYLQMKLREERTVITITQT